MQSNPELANDFERRLRAAVRAGAWLLLIPLGLLLLQWALYLEVMASRPAWFLSLLGSGFDWARLQTIWLFGMVIFKVLFWAHLLLVLWGALWASMLRKGLTERAGSGSQRARAVAFPRTSGAEGTT